MSATPSTMLELGTPLPPFRLPGIDGREHGAGRLGRHDLGAARRGVHVAVLARLIAELADVDLQNLDGGGAR